MCGPVCYSRSSFSPRLSTSWMFFFMMLLMSARSSFSCRHPRAGAVRQRQRQRQSWSDHA